MIALERKSPSEIAVEVDPHPEDESAFKTAFSEYLNLDCKVSELYADWSKRDPSYFGKIASPLHGVRCLRQDPFECTLSFICS